ncbi:unnamed protein product [Allacma fusca]|uniref:Uncharacterized protein n=1 Tax=Allacma fusca TaxID=39272 RepID=A0A8J2NQT6_9HEXA|nr:unnamed protein product [Allacma fusca]
MFDQSVTHKPLTQEWKIFNCRINLLELFSSDSSTVKIIIEFFLIFGQGPMFAMEIAEEECISLLKTLTPRAGTYKGSSASVFPIGVENVIQRGTPYLHALDGMQIGLFDN